MKDEVGVVFIATLCIAAYGFLMAERNRFSPLPAPAMLDYQPRRQTSARADRRVRPERHNPNSITTLRRMIARLLLAQLPHCPFCGSPAGRSSASMSASITHEAGREWLGAVRHLSSRSFTRLNFSSAVQYW